jgi:hypothetical protein
MTAPWVVPGGLDGYGTHHNHTNRAPHFSIGADHLPGVRVQTDIAGAVLFK